MADAGTYQQPEHGWCCFHCGETFWKYGEAYMHFGPRPTSVPACKLDRGVLIDLRAAEERVAELEEALGDIKAIVEGHGQATSDDGA